MITSRTKGTDNGIFQAFANVILRQFRKELKYHRNNTSFDLIRKKRWNEKISIHNNSSILICTFRKKYQFWSDNISGSYRWSEELDKLTFTHDWFMITRITWHLCNSNLMNPLNLIIENFKLWTLQFTAGRQEHKQTNLI